MQPSTSETEHGSNIHNEVGFLRSEVNSLRQEVYDLQQQLSTLFGQFQQQSSHQPQRPQRTQHPQNQTTFNDTDNKKDDTYCDISYTSSSDVADESNRNSYIHPKDGEMDDKFVTTLMTTNGINSDEDEDEELALFVDACAYSKEMDTNVIINNNNNGTNDAVTNNNKKTKTIQPPQSRRTSRRTSTSVCQSEEHRYATVTIGDGQHQQEQQEQQHQSDFSDTEEEISDSQRGWMQTFRATLAKVNISRPLSFRPSHPHRHNTTNHYYII